ncbi:putative recombinase [Streptomyces sp. NBRC 110611]|nr:putative recombinase [Streptomyces sp. NBRC 110611]
MADVQGPLRQSHSAQMIEHMQSSVDLTLTFLRQKREETKRLARIAPVDLGIPVVTAPR